MNRNVFNENKFSTTHKAIAWIILVIIVYGQIDTIIHLSLELLHILFEILESTLDHLVEHIFHTDARTTQIISFYLILIIAGLASYILITLIPTGYYFIKYRICNSYHRRCEKISGLWQATSTVNKVIGWAVLAVFSGMLVLGVLS
ncbi:hypothetical protein Metal_3612 [Methylomicrobium album BG8]|uniref:Uncharacterized protein n=1 Tax=Methylomicrobium album BG8 TaxID=686340 RepID=H8GGY4_METAL|nr:hypothetical protein Metal_3612 [Methylomicrobium album BG8]